jgi:TRAP-type C4-dicarboxylate transport system permease small subunit
MITPKPSRLRQVWNGLQDHQRLRIAVALGLLFSVAMTAFLWQYFDHDVPNFWSTSEGLTMIRSWVATALLFVLLLFLLFIRPQ